MIESTKALHVAKPCLGSLVPPSGFDPAEVRPTAPRQELQLRRVFGYRSHVARGNAHWVDDAATELAFHAAAVAVIVDVASLTQRFYRGHRSDIQCLAVCRGRPLVATGDFGGHTAPEIHLWGPASLAAVAVITDLPYGVATVGFAPHGARLWGVGMDTAHTVSVWDSASGATLGAAPGDSNRILHGVTGEAEGPQYVTVGVSHVKLWSKARGLVTGHKAVGGAMASHTFVSVCCVQSLVAAGSVTGDVFVFRGAQLLRTFRAHADFVGALADARDGLLLSGGRDGTLRLWRVDELSAEGSSSLVPRDTFDLGAHDPLCPAETPQDGATAERGRMCPRAISVAGGQLLVGTARGRIVAADRDFGAVRTVADGHYDDQRGGGRPALAMAPHPTEPLLFTCGSDRTLRLWSLGRGALVLAQFVVYPATACAVSPDAAVVAVGHGNGAFSVWSSTTLAPVVAFTRRHVDHAVAAVAYSPSGRYLAVVAGSARAVDIFDAKREYIHVVAVSTGCSAAVSVDWSSDSTAIRCATASAQVLSFGVPAGVALTSTHDLPWATQAVPVGWGAQGAWGNCPDRKAPRCCALSADRALLAVGYSDGQVRLYRYPCLARQTEHPSRLFFPAAGVYHGHGGPVLQCAFAADGSLLTAGADMAVLCWVVGAPPRTATDDAAPADVEGAVARGHIRELRSAPVPQGTLRSAAGAARSRLHQMTTAAFQRALDAKARRAHIAREVASQKRMQH